MKRRKNVNKYKVSENGEITNTQPTLSPKVQKLLEFMTIASALNDAIVPVEENNEEDIDNECKGTTNTTGEETIHS